MYEPDGGAFGREFFFDVRSGRVVRSDPRR